VFFFLTGFVLLERKKKIYVSFLMNIGFQTIKTLPSFHTNTVYRNS
jgi:hypothetical protein